jgi:hypothetical protein
MAIWKLAKQVHGWGRIRAVERLAKTQSSEIKAWLLREGLQNAVMFEYSAYTCAISGGLLDALQGETIDDELLTGAAQILEALVRGGPAEDMFDYGDGAAACLAFLRQAARSPSSEVRVLLAASSVRQFIEDRAERAGWAAQTRWAIRTAASTLINDVRWGPVIDEGLRTADGFAFNIYAEGAAAIGRDPWPARYEKQRRRVSDQWYFLMQTDDGERIDQVLDLARQQLNLKLVGSGPEASLGLGPGYADDGALDFVLQDLKRFPGKGWDLIRVGLRGRPVRLPNMALNALEQWDRSSWPEEADQELRLALEREPDERVRKRFIELLNT